MGKENTITLTEAMLENMLERAAEKGARKYCELQVENVKVKRDHCLRNTKKLLDNYRRFKTHAADAVIDEKIEQVTRTTFLYERVSSFLNYK